MSYFNQLSIQAWEPLADSIVWDNTDALGGAQVLSFETIYPGGKYGSAQIFIPLDIAEQWNIARVYPYRITIRNGITLVYEGWIDETAFTGDGVLLRLIGASGFVGERRGLLRLWSDNRISQDPWQEYRTRTGTDKTYITRSEGSIILEPKQGVKWNTSQNAAIRYDAPLSEKIYSMTVDYSLTTNGNATDWSVVMFNADTSTVEESASRTSSGTSTGTLSHLFTSSTYTTAIELRLRSDAANTPSDDSGINVRLELSGIMVNALADRSAGYADHLHEFVQDIIAKFSDTINSSTAYVSTNNLFSGGGGTTANPFTTESAGYEAIRSIFDRIQNYGDDSGNAWSAGFLSCEHPARVSWDGKPVVYYEVQPALDDYDYYIDAKDDNVSVGELEVSIPIGGAVNAVFTSYKDPEGFTRWLDPSVQSSLESTGSQNRYGESNASVTPGLASSDMTLEYGQRYLDEYKYATSKVSVAPFTVRGWIRNKGGVPTPVSEVMAGKRIKLVNFINPMGNNTANIHMIGRTEYRDADKSVRIYPGTQDTLDVVLSALRRQTGDYT